MSELEENRYLCELQSHIRALPPGMVKDLLVLLRRPALPDVVALDKLIADLESQLSALREENERLKHKLSRSKPFDHMAAYDQTLKDVIALQDENDQLKAQLSEEADRTLEVARLTKKLAAAEQCLREINTGKSCNTCKQARRENSVVFYEPDGTYHSCAERIAKQYFASKEKP